MLRWINKLINYIVIYTHTHTHNLEEETGPHNIVLKKNRTSVKWFTVIVYTVANLAFFRKNIHVLHLKGLKKFHFNQSFPSKNFYTLQYTQIYYRCTSIIIDIPFYNSILHSCVVNTVIYKLKRQKYVIFFLFSLYISLKTRLNFQSFLMLFFFYQILKFILYWL